MPGRQPYGWASNGGVCPHGGGDLHSTGKAVDVAKGTSRVLPAAILEENPPNLRPFLPDCSVVGADGSFGVGRTNAELGVSQGAFLTPIAKFES